VLYMYSGKPAGRVTLQRALLTLGRETVTYDKHSGSHQDLADDTVWSELRSRLQAGEFAFVFSSFPCTSSAISRHHPRRAPGPGPLRSCENIWGLLGLSQPDKEKVRLGNLHACRTAEAMEIQLDANRGAACEQPEPWEGLLSLLLLPPLLKLLSKGAVDVAFDQCPFGAASAKGTAIRFSKGTFESIAQHRCNHPKVDWTSADGTRYKASHPKLAGQKAADGSWLTSQAEAYPDMLNVKLAQCIDAACKEVENYSDFVGQCLDT
jgi:hypothetical protein